MDFKKLFRKNDKAVSPVIGVILMVAITVILAAAIGSSVFSHGTAKSAPQANLDIKSLGVKDKVASIKIEHLGGDVINFDKSVTKIMVSVNSGTAVQAAPLSLTTLGVGDIATLNLMKADATTSPIQDNSVNPAIDIATGNTVNIKMIDIQTSQIFLDRTIRL
ncbi:MAG TPA: type IV pilin [Methanobacterium sp.]|nr:type IV pilin [Methanobacterium sp.]